MRQYLYIHSVHVSHEITTLKYELVISAPLSIPFVRSSSALTHYVLCTRHKQSDRFCGSLTVIAKVLYNACGDCICAMYESLSEGS